MNRNLIFFNKDLTPIRKLLLMHVAAGGKLIDYTVVGNPVSFDTNVAKPLSVVASFSPVQSGSGDPSPENVRPITGWNGANVWRTGKNLFDFTQSPTTIDCFSMSGTSIKRKGFVIHLPPGTYKISGTVRSSCYIYGNVVNADDTYVSAFQVVLQQTASAISLTLTNGQYIMVYDAQEGSNNFANVDLMLELGETASTYEPYTGQSVSVTFPATGKNLLNPGEAVASTFNIGGFKNNLKTNTKYTFSINGTTSFSYALYMGNSEDPSTGVTAFGTGYKTSGGYATFTTPGTMLDMLVLRGSASGAGSESLDDILPMIEEGQTATTYEPFTNTAYGGTLDLSTGVLSVEWAMLAAKWSDWTYISTADNIDAKRLDFSSPVQGYGITSDSKEMYCNVAIKKYEGNDGTVHFYVSGTDSRCRVYLPEGTDGDLMVQVIARLKATLVYQLTPTEIQSLVGNNVLWSDLNGDMTVVYKKKG